MFQSHFKHRFQAMLENLLSKIAEKTQFSIDWKDCFWEELVSLSPVTGVLLDALTMLSRTDTYTECQCQNMAHHRPMYW